MKNKKQRSDFTSQFKEILDLTNAQIEAIDKIETKLYKDYFWSNNLSESALTIRYLKSIFSILSNDQIKSLKEYKKEQLHKVALKKQSTLQKSFESQSKRLQALGLSEDQLWQFVQAKSKWLNVYKKRNLEFLKEGGDQFNEELKEEIDKELFQPIFTTKQFEQYLKLVRKENEQQEQWRLKHSKANFENQYSIKLTDQQAVCIFEIESDRLYKNEKGEYLSDFEREEIKLQKFKEVLNSDQFESYQKEYLKRLERKRQELIQSNKGHYLKKLKEIQKTLAYYKKNVLPLKSEARFKLEYVLNNEQKEFLAKLKEEYFDILENRKKIYRAQHERHYLDLVPNELQANLISVAFEKIRINAYYLRDCKYLDKILASEIVEKVKREESKLRPVYQAFKDFQITLYEENGGDYGAWIHKVVSKEDNRNLQYLSLLLLEPTLEENLKRLKS